MAVSKIINSIKIDSTYFGKIIKIDSNGDVVPVTVRPEFIPLTGGTNALTQSSLGTYVYNIADFVGTGFESDYVQSIKVKCFCGDSGNSGTGSTITAVIGSETVTICNAQTNSSGSQDRDTNICDIPVNEGDTTITISITEVGNLGATFTILGATQFSIA